MLAPMIYGIGYGQLGAAHLLKAQLCAVGAGQQARVPGQHLLPLALGRRRRRRARGRRRRSRALFRQLGRLRADLPVNLAQAGCHTACGRLFRAVDDVRRCPQAVASTAPGPRRLVRHAVARHGVCRQAAGRPDHPVHSGAGLAARPAWGRQAGHRKTRQPGLRGSSPDCLRRPGPPHAQANMRRSPVNTPYHTPRPAHLVQAQRVMLQVLLERAGVQAPAQRAGRRGRRRRRRRGRQIGVLQHLQRRGGRDRQRCLLLQLGAWRAARAAIGLRTIGLGSTNPT